MTLHNRVKRLESLAASKRLDSHDIQEMIQDWLRAVGQHPHGPALVKELERIVRPSECQDMVQFRQRALASARGREIACRLAEIQGGLGHLVTGLADLPAEGGAE